MKNISLLFSILLAAFLASCGVRKEVYEARQREAARDQDPTAASAPKETKPKYIYGENVPDRPKVLTPTHFAEPLSIDRSSFVKHAQTYLGIPYKYGGTDPTKGLDCSGFVYCVFAHYGIKPPRSSKEYTHAGSTIDIQKAKPGDLILFTSPGTRKQGVVGHMGIITDTKPVIQFVHSSSGKNRGVIKSELKGYYLEHFVKVIRVLR